MRFVPEQTVLSEVAAVRFRPPMHLISSTLSPVTSAGVSSTVSSSAATVSSPPAGASVISYAHTRVTLRIIFSFISPGRWCQTCNTFFLNKMNFKLQCSVKLNVNFNLYQKLIELMIHEAIYYSELKLMLHVILDRNDGRTDEVNLRL